MSPMFSSSSQDESHDLLKGYGDNVFRGKVAAPYLKAQNIKEDELASGSWVKDIKLADAMAKDLLAWATDRGATSFCHWFQPMGAVRRGERRSRRRTRRRKNVFIN